MTNSCKIIFLHLAYLLFWLTNESFKFHRRTKGTLKSRGVAQNEVREVPNFYYFSKLEMAFWTLLITRLGSLDGRQHFLKQQIVKRLERNQQKHLKIFCLGPHPVTLLLGTGSACS